MKSQNWDSQLKSPSWNTFIQGHPEINHRPQPGSNSWTLGIEASMLGIPWSQSLPNYCQLEHQISTQFSLEHCKICLLTIVISNWHLKLGHHHALILKLFSINSPITCSSLTSFSMLSYSSFKIHGLSLIKMGFCVIKIYLSYFNSEMLFLVSAFLRQFYSDELPTSLFYLYCIFLT